MIGFVSVGGVATTIRSSAVAHKSAGSTRQGALVHAGRRARLAFATRMSASTENQATEEKTDAEETKEERRDRLVDMVSNRTFQLDELEDKDHTVTAVYLLDNGKLDFGYSTGPVPENVTGTWELDYDSNMFIMNISRTFEGGNRPYQVTRSFQGDLAQGRNMVEVDGKIYLDNFPVGFFKLFSTSDDLPEGHFRGL